MFPKPYFLPQILQNTQQNRNLIDLTNQYSFVKKLHKQSRSTHQYTQNSRIKLPDINKRFQYLQKQLKQRQIQQEQQKLFLNHLNKGIGKIKKHLLSLQQENRYEYKCNCKSNSNHMPFNPMMMHQMYGGQFSNPFYMGMQPQQNQIENNQKRSSKLEDKQAQAKNKQEQKKKKELRKKLIRKFRIIGYVVYFSIFFKYFSKKFTRNRFNYFKKQFLLNDSSRVVQDSYKITKSIQDIDLFHIILQLPKKGIQNFSQMFINSKHQIKSIKSINQIIPEIFQEKYVKSLNFLNCYLKQLRKVVLSQNFIQNYSQVISIGVINQSFFIDDLMLPQQINLITFDQNKGFAKISEQTQKLLLTLYIFIKHVLFKVLYRLQQKNYLQKIIGQNYQKYQKYQDQTQDIYQILQMSSTILYILIKNIYLQYLNQKNPQSNYSNLKQKFKIEPSKLLSINNYKIQKQQKFNINQLIFGIQITDNINQLLQKQQYQDYLGYLIYQIQHFVQNLLQQLKSVNRINYKNIFKQTLEQKNIIIEGIKGIKAQKKQQRKNSKIIQNNKRSSKNNQHSLNQFAVSYKNIANILQNSSQSNPKNKKNKK